MVGGAALFTDPSRVKVQSMQRSDDGSRGAPGGAGSDRGGRRRAPDETTGAGDVASSYRKAGPYLDASWQLAGSVALWVLIGYFLDKWLRTTPWLLVAGAVLGMGLGFYLFFKALSAIGRGEGR
jgi:F0F1-type ATP synthase assembly protein I